MAIRTLFPGKGKNKSKNKGSDDEISLASSSHREQEPQEDAKSFQYSYNSNSSSLFSSKRTMTTGNSSHPTSSFIYSKNNSNVASDTTGFTSFGRPLMVLREDEEEEEIDLAPTIGTSAGHSNSNRTRRATRSSMVDDESMASTEQSNQSIHSINSGSGENEFIEFVKKKLNQLANSMSIILIQVMQSVLSLTKAAINIGDLIFQVKNSISQHKYSLLLQPRQFTTSNTVGLRKIVKHILHLWDNILTTDVYDKSKALIIKNFYDLLTILKLVSKPPTGELTNFLTFLSPNLFAIGSNELTSNPDSPSSKIVNNIMNSLLSKEKEDLFNDQEGAFVAPVLRGFQTPDLSVVTFIFGFPELNREHHDVIKFFSRQAEEIHFFGQRNSIVPASIKTPFRSLERESQRYIPISMSISTNNAMTTSGTFGGYIYPKVPEKTIGRLEKYKGKVFGMTCSHVVLSESDISNKDEIVDHPDVSIPSPVLINMYKNALSNERNKYKGIEASTVEYQAFSKAIEQIDEVFPMKEINVKGKIISRNLPKEQFGNIVWGERLVYNNKLSDLAIIKVESSDKKLVNYLGDDIELTKFDPTLMLSNLSIKKVISLINKGKNDLFTVPHANVPVFKYGSTTSYTRGTLNGTKLIYWSDGSLRSNEFIINGGDLKNNGSPNDNNLRMGFAAGGDSGAWILSKLSDVNQFKKRNSGASKFDNVTSGVLTSFIESFLPSINKKKSVETEMMNEELSNECNEIGLGVLGMLHSYDGEYRQFGLFTPMDELLNRLKIITGLEWGVLGCDESCDEGEFPKDEMSLFSKDSDES